MPNGLFYLDGAAFDCVDMTDTEAGRHSWRALASGALLAVTLAIGAKIASHAVGEWLSPARPTPVSPVLCAVLLGVVWRNAVGLNENHLPGLHFVTTNLLRIGIALVGLRLSLGAMASTATIALPVVAACIGTALGCSVLAGRLLGLSQPLRLLLAVGTAVCGCTAIIAMSPILRARPFETGLALTCVVVLGCTGMILYPWLAHALFGDAADLAGIFLGTAIHDTSQVVGAALIYAQQFGVEAVVPVSGFTKLLRNLSLLVLVPLFVIWAGRTAGGEGKLQRSQVIPTFLIWFVLLAIARTAGDSLVTQTAYLPWWSKSIAAALGASELFLICGMTAVGLSVSLRDLRNIGLRALAAAAMVAIAVALCSLGLTLAIAALATRSQV